MKILLIHHCDSWGGAGVSLRDLCSMLLNSYDVTVCLPHLGSEVDGELSKINGINTVEIGDDIGMISAYNGGPHMISRTFFRNLMRIPQSAVRLEKILKADAYDLVILNSITLSWATKTVSHMRIPSILYIRETKVSNIAYLFCKYLANRHCSGTAYISDYDKRSVKLKTKHQAVIRDCIDIDQYEITKDRSEVSFKFGVGQDLFHILYVGGSDELKGYSVIISAMEKLQEFPAVLLIAGNVEEDKMVDSSNVIYLGKIFDMPELYHACDVLVFPSTKGHQARPAFEAGAARLPVVISDFPETSDEIKDGENGLTFLACDSDALADCLRRLIQDRSMAKKLGEKNYINTKKKHDFNACRADFLTLCEEILKGRRSAT